MAFFRERFYLIYFAILDEMKWKLIIQYSFRPWNYVCEGLRRLNGYGNVRTVCCVCGVCVGEDGLLVDTVAYGFMFFMLMALHV